jgi:hypothetical protein
MSGQPLVKPLDAERFRKEYLKTLDLQETNNKKNLEANRLFIKTGTPQQPTDTRTVEERFEDIERLKVEARPQLQQLMDGAEAEKVIQNATPLQMYFIIQAMPYFISTLKPKYQRGMFANVFFGELDRYIGSLEKATFDSDQVLLKEDMIPIRNMLSNLGSVNTGIQLRLVQNIDKLIRNSVSRADIEAIRRIPDPLEMERVDALFRERVKDMPTREEFNSLARGIVGRDQTGDVRGANSAARDFSDMVEGAVEGLVVSSSSAGIPQAEVASYSPYKTPEQIRSLTKGEMFVYMDYLYGLNSALFSGLGTSRTKIKGKKADEMKKWFLDNNATIKSLVLGGRDEEMPETPVAESLGGNGIKRKPRIGSGIAKPKKRSDHLQDKDIDWNAGVSVPKVARYMPFGRFVINKRRLGEGIISIRTPCGACLNDIKCERASPNVLSVVRTILGGGSPTFEDIEKMDDDERNYVHRLASRADLLDRLSIPAPDKKKDEQEINQFNIMKGQIMAGNDSSKLHKDFKMLVMRLMNKKLLPKRQATELLFTMATLGH